MFDLQLLILAQVTYHAGTEPLRSRGATRKSGLSPDKLAALAKKHADACAGYGPYVQKVHDAVAGVDESALNYDLIEAAVCHVVSAEAAGGSGEFRCASNTSSM